jgi:hypothetical protein
MSSLICWFWRQTLDQFLIFWSWAMLSVIPFPSTSWNTQAQWFLLIRVIRCHFWRLWGGDFDIRTCKLFIVNKMAGKESKSVSGEKRNSSSLLINHLTLEKQCYVDWTLQFNFLSNSSFYRTKYIPSAMHMYMWPQGNVCCIGVWKEGEGGRNSGAGQT